MKAGDNVFGYTVLREGYIHVTEAYVSDISDIRNRMLEAQELSRKSGLRYVLVDARHAAGGFSDIELEELGRFAKSAIGRLEWIAVVREATNEDDPWARLVRALRAVGTSIALFQNEAEALNWLRAASNSANA